MSSEGTPGYPAPDVACKDTAMTVSRPKASCRAFKAIVMPVEVQLGLVAMKPVHPRSARWRSINRMWSGLTSGRRMGTSVSRR